MDELNDIDLDVFYFRFCYFKKKVNCLLQFGVLCLRILPVYIIYLLYPRNEAI